MTRIDAENPDPTIQDELPAIVRSLRLPAGDDPRFSTPEGILSHRTDFFPVVYATWKNIHNRAVDQIVKIETILRSPDSRDFEDGLAWFLRRSQMIWRRVNDALVWSVLGLDKGHVVRLLCHWKPRPVLAEANLASMRWLLSELNRDPLSIALWTDATSCVDVGDLLCASLSGGPTGVVEVKAGKVNETISDIRSMNPRDPKTMERIGELARQHGLKALKQFERVIRQQKTLDQTLAIVENDEGFDPCHKSEIKIRESKIPEATYDGVLASLLKNSDSAHAALEVIDRCLWVYIDQRPEVSFTELVKGFSAALFERVPHIRAWAAERCGSDILQPVFTLDENLHNPAAIPIFFREFDPEMVRDTLIGRLTRRVLLYLDWVEYGRMLKDIGVTLTWGTEKAARAEHSKPRSRRAMIVGGRTPTITLPDGRFVRGQSKVYQSLFEGILPSVIAAQYAEMLRQD